MNKAKSENQKSPENLDNQSILKFLFSEFTVQFLITSFICVFLIKINPSFFSSIATYQWIAFSLLISFTLLTPILIVRYVLLRGLITHMKAKHWFLLMFQSRNRKFEECIHWASCCLYINLTKRKGYLGLETPWNCTRNNWRRPC